MNTPVTKPEIIQALFASGELSHYSFRYGLAFRIQAYGIAQESQEAVDCEAIAKLFHKTYERLAPSFGYETRQETKHFDPTSPNGKLMIAVCEVMYLMTPPTAPPPQPSIRQCNCPSQTSLAQLIGELDNLQWSNITDANRIDDITEKYRGVK